MKQDIILCGVGGQGILSIATVIGWAALDQNLHLKQAEVHGMSQRGGDVQSNLRLSSDPINSDLIPLGACDLIVSLEPMEALRYLPYLSPNGWIITNSTPFVNIPNYPEMDDVNAELKKVKNLICIDVDAIAKEVNSPRSANMVLLGATAAVLNMLEPDKLREGITQVFMRKGQAIVDTNIAAFNAGLEYAKKHTL
ncbi:MAG: indolepyruvate oxidoreductase subunit beta [Muribaculaceae bacterium]|jgi:indolepyruvate ferredoxin oxidoreductase beta subunit|nr:indolepyruvate oxidoreductase subunit beta [Muribaculaceae bacterium]MBQ1723594.1 indolepyruvate oxidoreductase subunit beta [Muribaculaceae bacterium]MBQ2491146.1 indolepyruvate oxidoreductase subunit beta [Muribaculaceae bacterium]MBQ3960926.1 indolepyruvate oxidoreductase subunit beta [Muribaculaceae bacterium]MBQ4009019.1 indolepyruvate oxidoreductase subunit beta [Muribaculaceae bacterium]